MICHAKKLWNSPQPGLEFCSMMTVLSDTKEGDNCQDALARLATKRLATYGRTNCSKCHNARKEQQIYLENGALPMEETCIPSISHDEKPKEKLVEEDKNKKGSRIWSRARMVNEEDRELSFDGNWAADWPVTPRVLAKCGFFYRGPEDVVECVSCSGTLMGWQTGDNPFAEHAKHYPKCPKFGKDALSATPIEKCCQSEHCQYDITGLLKQEEAIDHIIEMECRIQEEELRLMNSNLLKENLERNLKKKEKEMECFLNENRVDKSKIVKTKKMIDSGSILLDGAPQNMLGGWRWVQVLHDTETGTNTWKEVIRLTQAYSHFRDAHSHLGPENVLKIEARIPGYLDFIHSMKEKLRKDAHGIVQIKEMIRSCRHNQQQFCEHFNSYKSHKM